MRLCTLPALLAAALCSAVAVIPLVPALNRSAPQFVLEARIASSVTGSAKIYYDLGRGYNEGDSAALPVLAGTAAVTYRFPLPAGDYRSVRFDPREGEGTLWLDGPLRLLTADGRLRRTISWGELRPLQQIDPLRETSGRLEVRTSAGANDPQLVASFSPALRLIPTRAENFAGWWTRAATVFAGLALLLWVLDRTPRARMAFAGIARRAQARPSIAVALMAAGAVVLSAYPIVFLGKSHVSPNFGTTLLYDSYPTLPGHSSAELASANGSDIGPAAWQNIPYSFVQHRALAHGELPWWNRYTLTGTPLLGQGQSMFGDPLHFLVLLGRGNAWAWDLKYLGAKWLLAAGLGLTVLALLQTGVSQRPSATPYAQSALAAALIVTAAVPFIGFYLYRVNHPAIFTLGYAPWVMYAWVRLSQAGGRRAMAGSCVGILAASFALMNSGTVKEAAVLLLLMNLTGASLLLAGDAPARVRYVKLALAAWTGGLLLLITAPVWSTFLQTLLQAFTASMNAAADQIQPSLLLAAFDELFFRPLSREQWVFNPSLNFLLLLGLLYFVTTLRQQFSNRPVMAVAACAVGSMALAFGVVPRSWIVQLPFLGHVGHIDNTFLGGLVVLWSILAGVGFATAATRLRGTEGTGDLLIALAVLLAIVGAWIGFHQASHRAVYGPGSVVSVMPSGEVIGVSQFIWASLFALILASCILALVARHAARQGTLGPAGALLAGLCALVLLWRHGMHATPVGSGTYVLHPPPRADFRAGSPAINFVQAGQSAGPGRLFGLEGNVTPGWNAVYGLEAIHGPDALQNRWVRELIDASPLTWSSMWRLHSAGADVARFRPVLDAFNVRFYLDLPSNPPLQDSSLTLAQSADLNVYESATAWPRAFFTDRLHVYATPAELVQKMEAASGRPFAAAQYSDTAAVGSGLSPELATRTFTAASDYVLTPNTTSFTVQANSPGAVVLTEAFWPGDFRAEVNGRKARVLRLNHAFKGVTVDAAGEYRITFRYVPKNFPRNLALSATGVVLLAASLWFGLRSLPERAA